MADDHADWAARRLRRNETDLDPDSFGQDPQAAEPEVSMSSPPAARHTTVTSIESQRPQASSNPARLPSANMPPRHGAPTNPRPPSAPVCVI